MAAASDTSTTNIHASFHTRLNDDFTLNVDLELPGQGITTLFGHSGSGKTTLLRCIAGLETADEALLSVNGEAWASAKKTLPPHQRAVGYVFQESSLFPHLSVQGNLDYAIKRAWHPVDDAFYQQVITMLGIESLFERMPDKLSGGEKQRVAIARALLIKPRLMLMDEPLASLDYSRKQEVLPYLERLKTQFEVPIIYVSHSLDEVARLADYSVLLDKGQVVAKGTPAELFSRVDLPHHFRDQAGAILQGEVTAVDSQWHLIKISFSGGELWIRESGEAIGDQVRVRILARDVSLTEQPCDQSSILNRVQACVEKIADDIDPAMSLIQLRAGNDILVARITKRSLDHLKLSAGRKIWAQLKSVAIVR